MKKIPDNWFIVKGLVETGKLERKVSKDYIQKVGIEVGGGFLKVCFNIIEKVTEYIVKKKFNYEEGIGN